MITNDFFRKNNFFKKENIKVFWKENNAKSDNKDALKSGSDRYTAKNYITT